MVLQSSYARTDFTSNCRFLDRFPPRDRATIAAVFADGLSVKSTVRGLVDHARLVAAGMLAHPHRFENLCAYKRHLIACQRSPAAVAEYAAGVLSGGMWP